MIPAICLALLCRNAHVYSPCRTIQVHHPSIETQQDLSQAHPQTWSWSIINTSRRSKANMPPLSPSSPTFSSLSTFQACLGGPQQRHQVLRLLPHVGLSWSPSSSPLAVSFAACPGALGHSLPSHAVTVLPLRLRLPPARQRLRLRHCNLALVSLSLQPPPFASLAYLRTGAASAA